MTSDEVFERSARAIAGAEALLVAAGAGMGVDSGLPAYRGNPDGAYPAAGGRKISYVGMSNPRRFDMEPEVAWGFYGHQLALYRRTAPHQGFEILRRWASQMPAGHFVLTSNVDGQFQRAGFDEHRLLEGHGSIHWLQCTVPCGGRVWSAGGLEVEVDEATLLARPPLPICPDCGALARPNIFMFGDTRFNQGRAQEQLDAFDQWLVSVSGRALVVVECGAGTAIPTIRLRCQDLSRERHGALIRINPKEPEGPAGTISIPLGAAEALASIDRQLAALPGKA